FVESVLTVGRGEEKSIKAQLYAGPEITEDLGKLAPGLELAVDYGILWPICQPIFWLLKKAFQLTSNWGLAIILTTIIIKALFYKLSASSYRSMGNMRKLQPKLEALKQRFGDDKQKYSQGMMELYKKEKINPLGGCLPVLVQIPVFIALYYVLLGSVELREAPFYCCITDLSGKDPYYVLPILMGLSMLVQQKLSPAPPDPVQAKVMMLMPVVFTVLFLNFPSGLVLYWFVNNVLSIAQQWFITRRIELSLRHGTK
ncbi:MAG TPA: membrane protein insertase YidC, partial [Gammaproteobacteria bacterium]|nr:membrane protein insertase YidC [Gammaproteobacteria bacterium]